MRPEGLFWGEIRGTTSEGFDEKAIKKKKRM